MTGRRASGSGLPVVGFALVVGLIACAGAVEPAPRVQPPPREQWLIEGPIAAQLDRAQLVQRFGAPQRIESQPIPNRHDPSVTDSIVQLHYAGARYVYYVVTQGSHALLDDALIRDPSHLRYAAPGIGTPADSLRAWWGEPTNGTDTTLEYDCTSCETPHPATFVIQDGVVREIRFDFYVD